MVRNSTRLAVITGTLAVLLGTGAADPVDHGVSSGQTIMPPPPTYKGTAATVTEHLGAKLPLDAVFRDHTGKQVTLGQIVVSDLPTIVTFNYADCPMLCSQQLNGLTAAMPKAVKRGPVVGSESELSFALGEHYRIVTISLQPDEQPAKLTKMRTRYLDRVTQLNTEAGVTVDPAKLSAGWTYLTGSADQIKRVADAIGFGYAYIDELDQWAHPAAYTFVSSGGVITRYVYGINLENGVLQESIYKAGLAEPTTATGFMLRCYHWDPSASDHSRVGVIALRVGAASAVALLAAFGIFTLARRKPRSREVT